MMRYAGPSTRFLGLILSLLIIIPKSLDIWLEGSLPLAIPLGLLAARLPVIANDGVHGFTRFIAAYVGLSMLFCVIYWYVTSRRCRYPKLGMTIQSLIAISCMSLLILVVTAQVAILQVASSNSSARTERKQWWIQCVHLMSQHGMFATQSLLFLTARGVIFFWGGSDSDVKMIYMYFLHTFAIMFLIALIYFVALSVKRTYLNRIALAQAQAQLQATHVLLQESARHAERARIARDVHDLIGHHVTALNLHLDLAQRQTSASSNDEFKTALLTSKSLAQTLLCEVRQVVAGERNKEAIDLKAALLTLCNDIPRPKIDLHFHGEVKVHSIQVAHHLFCCIAEAMSNTIRHADAQLLKIDLCCGTDGLTITLLDDGRGWNEPGENEGFGLSGMRQRVRQLGGRLYLNRLIHRLGRHGFSVEIVLPSHPEVQCD